MSAIAAGMLAGLAQQGGQLGVNIATGALSNYWAAKREADARKENFRYNETAAIGADNRARKMYADLMSPEALLQQYKDANLSPSLMFGGGGPGGSTPQGAQGQGAAGISPTVYGVEPAQMADIQLKLAQAKKLDAETKTISGENDRGWAEIQNLLKEGHAKDLENNIKTLAYMTEQINYNLHAEYAGQIKSYEVQRLSAEVRKTLAETEKAEAEGEISQETKNAIIEKTKKEVEEVAARILLTRAQEQLTKHGVTLTRAQAVKCLNDIAVDNAGLMLRGKELELNRSRLNAEVQNWAVQNGIADEKNKIEVAKILLKAMTDSQSNVIKLVDAVIPF